MIDKATITKAIQLLQQAAPQTTVTLFGSYARGDADEQSDLDLLVVDPNPRGHRFEAARLRALLRTLKIPVDVIVVGEKTFQEWRQTPGMVIDKPAQTDPPLAAIDFGVHIRDLLVPPAPSKLAAASLRKMLSLRHAPQATPPPPDTAIEVKMPNLVGTSEATARAALARLGVTHVKASQTSSDLPAGEVVKQAPAPGIQVGTDTQVELAVSSAHVTVPDLGRMNVQDATVALNRVNLVVGTITGDQGKGKVSTQKPSAGANVAPGTAIDLRLTTTRGKS